MSVGTYTQSSIARKLAVESGFTRLGVANNEHVGIGDPAINRGWRWKRRGRVMRRCNRGCLRLGEGQIAAGSQRARYRYEGAQ